MLRYTVLSVLLVACHVRAQASDGNGNSQASNQGKDLAATDVDANVDWLKKFLPKYSETVPKTGNRVNLDPSNIDLAATDVDADVDWLKKFLPKYSETVPKTGNRVNLDPSNIVSEGKVSCSTDDNKKGQCVKLSECDKVEQKVDLPETKFIERQRGPCHYLQVCCPLGQIRETPRKPEPLQDRGCGYSNPGASIFREKSSGYGYADSGEFPWMVALLKTGADGWVDANYLGGGTIIHPSVVMTTARKVDTFQPSDLKCRAGELDTQTDNEQYPHQERAVAKIIVHEEYNREYHRNNIALLILKEPFEKQPHVGVACLSRDLPPPGTECYSMGWGEDFIQSKKYANLLKKIPLPLVAPDDCERRYRNTRLGSNYFLHRSLTCAGGEAMVDTCVGDGGSPLVCPEENTVDRYAVVGMVGYGLECGTANIPGVYAKVPEFYVWVGEKMTQEGFNKSSYEVDTSTNFIERMSKFQLR